MFERVEKIIVLAVIVFVGDRSVELGVCLTCGAAWVRARKDAWHPRPLGSKTGKAEEIFRR